MSDPTQTCPPARELIILQEGPVLEPLVLTPTHVIQLCFLLNVFNSISQSLSVEESLDTSLVHQKHSLVVKGALLMVAMLMEQF